MDRPIVIRSGKTRLRLQLSSTVRGKLQGAILEVERRRVGTITVFDPGPTPDTIWLLLDREPDLADPLRFMCLATPLLASAVNG